MIAISGATHRGIIARGIPVYPDPENMGRTQRQQHEAEQVLRRQNEIERYILEQKAEIARIKAEARAVINNANKALRWMNCVEEAPGAKTTFDEIIRRISDATGISRALIVSDTRSKPVVFARMAVCYWARRLTHLSLPQIGKRLGGRDHTSILHSVREYPKRRAAMGRNLRAAA